MSDAFSTNTHYCLSVLAFADALVLAYVDLAGPPAVGQP